MAVLPGYIGTYSSPQSRGVYHFTFSTATGALTTPTLFFEARNPKCVALSAGVLAVPIQRDDRAGIALLNANRPDAPLIEELCCEKRTSCFIAIRADYLCAANYHEGLVIVYRRGERMELVKRIEIGAEAGCHQVLFHAQSLLVPCLERDELLVFDTAHDFAQGATLRFPVGSGPRHGVFDCAHRNLYVVTERSHELFWFHVSADGFALAGVFPIFGGEQAPTEASTAAVRLSPDERFLYVSTRGADVLTVFALEAARPTYVQQTACGGRHPRDFVLSPDGRFLLALNRDSGNLVSFPRDTESGRLGAPVSEVTVHEGSGIVLGEAL